jgi:hypothetical protein
MYSSGMGTRTEPGGLAELSRQTTEFRRLKQIEFVGQNNGEIILLSRENFRRNALLSL